MVDKSRSRREGGAGIGMALCERIVQIHGAQLRIDSDLGEGTVVKILLPPAGRGGTIKENKRKKKGKLPETE